MNINIKTIKDRGSIKDERLILEVRRDAELGRYVVFNAGASPKGGVSNVVEHTFWFPDKRVHRGDLIILYSGFGEPTEASNTDGSVSHFYYWGRRDVVWGREDDFAVLLRAGEWDSFPSPRVSSRNDLSKAQ